MHKPDSDDSSEIVEGTDIDSLDSASETSDGKKEIGEFKKQYIRTAVFIVAGLIAICAMGIAWFANNTKVIGSNASIKSEGIRFELASAGESIGKYDGANGIIGDVDGDFHTTSGDKTSISWWVNDTSNIGNIGDNDTVASLRPGSKGQINFSIIEKADDLGEMHFTVEIIPYKSAEQGDTGAIEIENGEYAVPIEKEENAYKLFMGHFLLFQKKQDSFYSDWFMSGNVISGNTIKVSDGTNPKRRNYTIYWIWPEVLNNYVKTADRDSLFNTVGDQKALLDYINDNHYNFFIDNAGTNTPTDIGTISTGNGTGSLDLDRYTRYYNNGDELIGNTVRYIQFKVTARE